MTNLMLSSNVLLPEFFNTQMEMGFFLVSQKRNDFKAGFLFGLHRTIKLPILKAVDLKVFTFFV